MSEQVVDVVIIGGSMAGSCLARNLKLKIPKLKITVLEKKKNFDHGIGESMLEVFWDYASRDLGLSKYLEANYFYKHGLRFFFEKEGKNTPVSEMSEMGRTWYHAIPAHQINRAQFDEDMVKLNEQIGIDTERGVSVSHIDVGEGEELHRVVTANGDVYRCRWMVDASGLSSVFAQKFRDVEKLDAHPVSSAWMRVKNMRDLDELGDSAWRERVRFTNRSLSTNHFMYRGYWVWMIPLDAQTVSIGVVWHHEKSQVSIKNQKELEAFLLSHTWGKELFGHDYQIVDFGALKNMARVSKTIFSTQRWFRTGMAAGFIDPLFSSGSAWLTDLNRMISDIIQTDIEGDQQQVARKVAGYDVYAHWWFNNFLFHITGNYHGNYDLHKVLFRALLMDYFGIVMPAGVGEYWKNFSNLDSESLEKLKTIFHDDLRSGGAAYAHKIKDELAEFLDKTGDSLSNNIGNFHDVEIPGVYMKNSMNRGIGLDDNAIKEMRFSIEMESIIAASKVVAEHKKTKLSENDIAVIEEKYKMGEINNLEDAIKAARLDREIEFF
ncbi:NAD(P)/FAD-dependent oxidoreductase [Alcaligenes sp. SDU_A2]|uniref:NAD(P)/FAD-dependent oxidoreductase n=1 Tax=Alcaligenes sp. SDU_A2 TaxID=3136634 RepID=UPI00311DECC5